MPSNSQAEFDENLKQLIDSCQVVSFDVFDTLMIRLVAKPADVFLAVERASGVKGFHAARIVAEHEARRRAALKGVGETTLDEIYEVLQEYGPAYAVCRQTETELEKFLSISNPDLIDAYEYCRKAGKRVVAISDMYLPISHIEEILDAAGIHPDRIYLSSDRKSTKYKGDMFDTVLSEEGVRAPDMLHIGDDPIADILKAGQRGIKTYHYHKPIDQARRKSFINRHLLSLALEQDNLFASCVTGQLVLQWLGQGKPDRPENIYHWLGYCYSGPIGMAFLGWISEQAAYRKIGDLFFMHREGELLKKLWDAFDLEPRAHLINSSRRMYLLASLDTRDGDWPRHIVVNNVEDGPAKFIKSLKLSERSEKILLSRLNGRGAHPPEDGAGTSELLKNILAENADLIAGEARTEREGLQSYFHGLGINDLDPDRTGFVDIGWNLSSHKWLEAVMGAKFHGFYLGAAHNAYNNGKISGYAWSYQSLHEVCLEILELLFCGTTDSIIKIHGDHKVFQDENEWENQRKGIARQIHEGALAFARDFRAVFERMDVRPTGREVVGHIDALMRFPEDHEVEAIQDVPHSKGLGDGAYKPIRDFWEYSGAERESAALVSFKHSLLRNQKYRRFAFMLRLAEAVSAFRIIKKSGYFDREWYISEYPDVLGSNYSPLWHYALYGVYEGRNPSTFFDTVKYLEENRDVAASGMNPLVHYIKYGMAEGRGPA